MTVVNRLEIIASSQELARVLEQLDKAEVSGYSVIRDVIGKGTAGRVSDDFDLVSTTLSNVYIVSFCSVEKVDAVLARLRPVLAKFGGVCYVSEATKML